MLVQLTKYGFFGILATLIHLLSAWTFIYLFESSLFYANLFAFLIAFLFSYIFQTLYVFESTFEIKKFIRFFAVQFGVFLISYFVSYAAALKNQYLQTLFLVILIPLLSFFVHKLWTFKKP